MGAMMPTTREYEWRDAKGASYRRAVAADACAFYLMSYKLGWVVETKPRFDKVGAPDKSPNPDVLRVFVVSTGERVFIDGQPGVRARLYDEPLTTWVTL
jgi:hypothetical protein